MKNKLLLEGAVAGHMNHIYDNGEMTFGELKQLLQAAVDGKLRGTEKTDGQNVFLSFDVSTQKARAIRNKTHIKAGGLNVEQFDDFFSAHPNQALRYSFVEALQAFEDIIKQIDKETQLKIFGKKEENIYFNTEVMNPGVSNADPEDPRSQGTTNVIPYDKKTLLIHEVGHGMFNSKTALPYDDPESLKRVAFCYSELENAIIGKSTEDPEIFSVEAHPRRKLESAGMSRAGRTLPSAIKAIDNLVQDFGLNDSSTIQDMVMVQIKPIIDNFGLTEDRNKDFILRLMGLCRSLEDPEKLVPCGTRDPETGKRKHHPPINIRDLTAGVPQELSLEIREFDDQFKYQQYTASLSNSLYEFTNAILQDFDSSFIADNEKAIRDLQDEIKRSIEKIKTSSNEAAKQDLLKQMKKLQNVDNVNTPSEGFVFNFNGTTYKFTGWFAPSNQILGTERYGRFGPLGPSTSDEDSLGANTKPLTVAIYPGSFKPPHLGHLRALQIIENRVAKGELPEVEKYYIIISNPLDKARPLPMSGKTISAEQAKMMWQIMLEGSTIKNKVQLIAGGQDTVSPMKVTIDYVTKQPDPVNLLVAPPESKVILVVGDKDSDAKRFKGLRGTVKEKRPDIELYPGVVPEQFHKNEYIELVNSNPSIKSGLKGNFKTFSASDARFVLDLAGEEPIGLEMLQYFVAKPDHALAYLGIIGLNPADQRDNQSDQVIEPEIDEPRDELDEIIENEAALFYERFTKQKVRRGKPDSGTYQTKMRKRLSKAHATYLDKGRKDLTKYGGAFHLGRPKNISNAFLAEDEIEEMSAMAAGNVQISAAKSSYKKNKPKRRKNKMKNQEKRLRAKIRESLKEFFKTKSQYHESEIATILEEHRLRKHLRNLVFDQALLNESEDPNLDLHDSTGMNKLKELFANTNILSTLRTAFQSLQTEREQRLSFRAHIIQWTKDTLAPVRTNDQAGQGESVSEAIDIDIEGVEGFIDADDGSIEKKPQDDGKSSMDPIEGQDTTGRNEAVGVYPKIETSITSYYAILDDSGDQELFYDYLIANLKMYFDKWENEISKNIQEPESEEYNQATSSTSPEDPAAIP